MISLEDMGSFHCRDHSVIRLGAFSRRKPLEGLLKLRANVVSWGIVVFYDRVLIDSWIERGFFVYHLVTLLLF
jgi:hypothetical protein